MRSKINCARAKMRITNYSIFRDWRGNWYQAYLCYGCLLALESSLQILSGCLSIAKTVMNSSFSFVWFLYFFFVLFGCEKLCPSSCNAIAIYLSLSLLFLLANVISSLCRWVLSIAVCPSVVLSVMKSTSCSEILCQFVCLS